jgi:hypothetical protein
MRRGRLRRLRRALLLKVRQIKGPSRDPAGAGRSRVFALASFGLDAPSLSSLPGIPKDRTKMANRSSQDKKMPNEVTEADTLEDIKNRTGAICDAACCDQNESGRSYMEPEKPASQKSNPAQGKAEADVGDSISQSATRNEHDS